MAYTDRSKIIVVGAGAMGAVFGGLLAEGGLDVTLVDVWQAHVDAINANGLRILGQGGDRNIPVRATTKAADILAADVVFFQCKAIYNREAAASVKYLFAAPNTVAISFQNGLGNEPEIASVLGEDRVLGGLTAQAAILEAPGVVRNHAHLPSYIGEMSGGLSDRAQHLAELFTRHGLPTTASADIAREKWRKLLVNIAFAATSGVANLTLGEVVANPALRDTAQRAMQEAIAVATAEGIDLTEGSPYEVFDKIVNSGAAANKSSLCGDILAKRRSEREYIYGTAIRLGEKHQVPTPTLKTLSSLVEGIEQHYAKA